MNLREQLSTWSWKRVGIALLIIWVGLWIVEPAILNVMACYYGRQIAALESATSLLPQPLPTSAIADLGNNPGVTSLGWTLQVPSAKIVARQDGKTFLALNFDDGGKLIFIDPSTQTNAPAMYRQEGGAILSIFPPEELRSQYDFMSAEMKVVPADLSIWHSRKRNVRVSTLLGLKGIDAGKSTAIYPISITHLRGFQFGDPAVPHSLVRVRLYDEKDHALEFILHSAKTTGWSQEQMNAFIASVKPAQ